MPASCDRRPNNESSAAKFSMLRDTTCGTGVRPDLRNCAQAATTSSTLSLGKAAMNTSVPGFSSSGASSSDLRSRAVSSAE